MIIERACLYAIQDNDGSFFKPIVSYNSTQLYRYPPAEQFATVTFSAVWRLHSMPAALGPR